MEISMQLFLYQFGFTRMAQNAEKDILVVYSKRNVCFYYGRVIHVITLFFYGEYDGNIFILIWRHQDGLERREEHPGGVQQDKTSILNYLLATGCCSRTVLHQNVALFWFCIVMANSSILYNILILKLIYKIYSNKLKQGYNMYHMSIMGTYVSLAVLHQDVLLGIQGHPGDEKSRQKYFHRIYHKKIQL